MHWARYRELLDFSTTDLDSPIYAFHAGGGQMYFKKIHMISDCVNIP